jgi:hypothetical protein
MPILTDLGVNPGTPMVASVRHIIEGRERALDALSARRRSVLHRRLSDHGKAVRQGLSSGRVCDRPGERFQGVAVGVAEVAAAAAKRSDGHPTELDVARVTNIPSCDSPLRRTHLQSIDTGEIIEAVHARLPPVIPASAGGSARVLGPAHYLPPADHRAYGVDHVALLHAPGCRVRARVIRISICGFVGRSTEREVRGPRGQDFRAQQASAGLCGRPRGLRLCERHQARGATRQ